MKTNPALRRSRPHRLYLLAATLATAMPAAADVRLPGIFTDQMNPDGANLYNRDGLPASPFRTDNW